MSRKSEKKGKPAFVDPRNARIEGGYQNVIQDIIAAGVCPFCMENFSWHEKSILHNEGIWFITENAWPYDNAKYHFLIICKVHKDSFDELNPDDFRDVSALIKWVSAEFKITGGGLMLRFGDTRYTGASVSHLHFHLIVPKLNRKRQALPVWFPVG